MKVKRIVSTGFWTDEKVIYWTPEDKYFMLYLLTNPHSEPCGIYELPPKIAAFELGYSEDAVRGLLDRFENNYKVIARSGCEIAIKNFLKYSTVKGGKPIFDCLVKSANGVKDKALLSVIKEHLKDSDEINQTVKDFLDTIKEKESNKEKENNESECVCVCENTECTVQRTPSVREVYADEPIKEKWTKRFVKPTIEEIRAYCEERQNGIDPEHFFDHYESNGWFVGKTHMKNWKATVRNWERNNYNNQRQPKRMSRAERQRLEDEELERMCQAYDSSNGETNPNDYPRKLSK